MCIFGVLGVKPNTNKFFLFTARGIKPHTIVKNLYSRNSIVKTRNFAIISLVAFPNF